MNVKGTDNSPSPLDACNPTVFERTRGAGVQCMCISMITHPRSDDQRAALGEEREHVAVAAEVADLLHLGKHVLVALAHPDDEVRAEPFRSKNIGRGIKDFSICPS